MISRETEQLLELVSREKQKYTKRENLIFDSEELSKPFKEEPQNHRTCSLHFIYLGHNNNLFVFFHSPIH